MPRKPTPVKKAVVRQFPTGANRDRDDNKLNYRGFLNPFVIKRFAEYMHQNRHLADGSVRAADNWQKGIPREVYMESLERHVQEVKQIHEAEAGRSPEAWGKTLYTDQNLLLDALSAIIFNAQGMMLEVMKGTEIEEAA